MLHVGKLRHRGLKQHHHYPRLVSDGSRNHLLTQARACLPSPRLLNPDLHGGQVQYSGQLLPGRTHSHGPALSLHSVCRWLYPGNQPPSSPLLDSSSVLQRERSRCARVSGTGDRESYALNLPTKTLEPEYQSLLENSGRYCTSGRGGETSRGQ